MARRRCEAALPGGARCELEASHAGLHTAMDPRGVWTWETREPTREELLEIIVREVAERDPEEGRMGSCHYCGLDIDAGQDHASNCLRLRALRALGEVPDVG